MIGKEISHYKVLRKIGQGGMGEVYLAMDTKLGRKVALKFLPEKFTIRKEARERFKREARAAAVLNHPNIVTVYEIDEFEGLIYMAMEYIEGETLAEKIEVKEEGFDNKTIPLQVMQIKEVVSIALEAGKGLQEAHQAGIVHRDIKLENIMIGGDERVKILDFGLAVLKGVSRLTEESVTMGTAFYMSPEQLRGEEFDQSTDIWSLGVVMYIMATGRFPFQGKTALDTMYAITEREPESVARINKTAPPGFERIVKRCLKKNPKDRYQDMTELIADLEQLKEAIASGKAVPIRTLVPLSNLFRKPAIKTVVPILASILVLMVFLLSPSVSLKVRKLLGFKIVPSSKQLAVLPFNLEGKESADNRAFCLGLTETLTCKLCSFERFEKNLLVIPPRRLKEMRIEKIKEARESFGVNLVINFGVLRENDSIHLTLDLVDAKKQQELDSQVITKHISELCDFQKDVVIQIIRMMEIELNSEMEKFLIQGGTTVPGAYDRYLRAWGYLRDAAKLDNIDAAIDLFKRAIQIDTDYALAYAGLAEAYHCKYNADKDDQWAQNAINYCGIALERDNRLACVYITLGKIHNARRQYTEAVQALYRALAINSIDAEAYYWLAQNYLAQENYKEAEEIYRKAVRLRPKDSSVLNNLGAFYIRQNSHGKALEVFQEMVKQNPDYIKGLINLGSLYFYLERRDEAREMFERSLSIKPTYEAYSNLGTLYFHQGLFDLAIERFNKALALRDRDFRIWGYLAESYYWAAGKKDKVRTSYQRAAELAEKGLNENPNDPDILSDLAFYYERLGNRARSLELLDKLVKSNILNPVVMLTIANTYEQMGRRDTALQWIDTALAKGLSLAEVENNPGLSKLRADSRYQELLQKRKDKNGESG